MDVRIAAPLVIGLLGLGGSAGLLGCSYDWDLLAPISSGGGTGTTTSSGATAGSGGTATTSGSGGTATTSSTGSGGSAGSCTAAEINLCAKVPAAGGASGDVAAYPFCELPVARFNLTNKDLYNGTVPDPMLDKGPEIRMGWVEDGIILHVAVPDEKVLPVDWDGAGDFKPYNGDSFEIFIKGDDDLNGDYKSMSGDIGAIHLIMVPPHESGGKQWPSQCPVATETCAVKFIDASSSEKIDEELYGGSLVPGYGYELYAKIPRSVLRPGNSAPLASNEPIALTFAWNQRSKEAEGQVRDFQLYYALELVTPNGETPCPKDPYVGAPDCDDRSFCTTKLE